ncbi:peptidoglycan-binding protein [Luteimonas sp. Y-2-2-4F]|nr:peptidoglycan-binding protein [Luteimonas sp. Y-2-2-4F]MCD9030246.1 peptidoglycan-binding protein [Luteimonas sp. Y-2-2-4F]
MARIDDRWAAARPELEEAARTAGVDVGVMAKIAGFESGFNPQARPVAVTNPENNTVRQFDGTMAISSAYGYGQFLNATWQDMINRHGEKYGVENAAEMTRQQANAPELRQDTRLQAAMLAEFTRENIERASRYGGQDVAANVYAMHNLGEGDGPRFLQALRDRPDARIDSVLSDRVISGNGSLYGDGSRTVAESYAAMGRQMDRYAGFAEEAERGLPSGTLTRGQGGRDAAPRDPMADGQLSLDERGDAVRELQGRLAQLGYTGREGQPLVADASFGANTRHAVEQFQRDQGLQVDGAAGRETLQRIEQLAAGRTAAADAAPHGSAREDGAPAALREGDRNDSVRALQETLNRLGVRDAEGRPLETDGRFGARTEHAVEAFQRANGLEADGVVGPDTRKALERAQQETRQQDAGARQPAAEASDRSGLEAMLEAAKRGDVAAMRSAVSGFAASPQGQAWLQQGEARCQPQPERQAEIQQQAQEGLAR